jgi:hypothetical protein
VTEVRAFAQKSQPPQASFSPAFRTVDAAAAISPAVDEAQRSSGQPLDGSTRTFMASRFGQDFASVRVHSDDAAALGARALGARAYTIGSHVFFGSGQYSPSTVGGQKLLAHELTHVVQQRGAGVPVVQRAPDPAAPSILERRATRVIAECDASGTRRCNIDQLSRLIFNELTSSPLAYVIISGRTKPGPNREAATGAAHDRADVLMRALIQWIGPNKFADRRFEVDVIDGSPGEPEIEIRVAFRPDVQSDPRSPLPTPAPSPLPFVKPPRKEGSTGVPPPPAGPSRDDPKSAEDRQKDWTATIVPEAPGKTDEQRKSDLAKKDADTLENLGSSILDGVTAAPEVKKLLTDNLDPVLDNLPAAVVIMAAGQIGAAFYGLYKTRGELPMPKLPAIKLSTGKIAAGMDTRVQFTFRGPVNNPTEISASFTLLKSGHPNKLPEGAEINLAVTFKAPDPSKPVAPDNLAAWQSAAVTVTIPLPGDPKSKK